MSNKLPIPSAAASDEPASSCRQPTTSLKKRLSPCQIVLLALGVVIIVLELLPYGAVLRFASPDIAGGIRKSFSYFDLVPFGYANLGPLPTALLSVILLILSPFSKKGCLIVAIVINALALVTSLLPLFHGVRYYSFIGFLITLMLGACLVIRSGCILRLSPGAGDGGTASPPSQL